MTNYLRLLSCYIEFIVDRVQTFDIKLLDRVQQYKILMRRLSNNFDFLFWNSSQLQYLWKLNSCLSLLFNWLYSMFQKETIPVSFEEEYKNISYVLKALNDSLVFLVE